MKPGQESLGSLNSPRVKKEKPRKVNLKAVSVPPNILERIVFQNTSLKWWYTWLIIVFSITTVYFLLIQTHLSTLPVVFEALQELAQVHQSKQLHVICAMFPSADFYHSQHTFQLSSDRISPLALDKLRAVWPRHKNISLYDIFHFPHPH